MRSIQDLFSAPGGDVHVLAAQRMHAAVLVLAAQRMHAAMCCI